MRIVGLTGGIATGKSTVSALIRASGIPVIDCDLIAHKVVKKGKWGWKRVISAFGQDILTTEGLIAHCRLLAYSLCKECGEIDRDRLGAIVFNDTEARRKLNRATHFPILVEMSRQILREWLMCRRIVVVDMPLLFEIKANKYFKPTVMVWCDEKTQLERLMQRDASSQQDASARIGSQMNLDTKKSLADVVIDNSGTEEELTVQVAKVVDGLKKGNWKSLMVSPVGLAGWGVVLHYALKAL